MSWIVFKNHSTYTCRKLSNHVSEVFRRKSPCSPVRLWIKILSKLTRGVWDYSLDMTTSDCMSSCLPYHNNANIILSVPLSYISNWSNMSYSPEKKCLLFYDQSISHMWCMVMVSTEYSWQENWGMAILTCFDRSKPGR